MKMKSNNLKRGEINENCGREICLRSQQKNCSLCEWAEIVVHSSLGQKFIRHKWKASLPDVRLSKFVKVASVFSTHSQSECQRLP